MTADVAPPIAAPQQSRGPRPLPLFLDLVREAAASDPELARAALAGLRRYQQAEAPPVWRERPPVEKIGGTFLRDCGGNGPTLVLVPSLINPPHILDLDEGSSLAQALSRTHRVLLLDWGKAVGRRDLDLTAHITERLIPLVERFGHTRLIGYCLGGTLALAAARQLSSVEAVVTLASPWRFSAYPREAVGKLQDVWHDSQPAARTMGGLPMEVLQATFWKLDPARTVAKYARFADFAAGSIEERRFLMLEDWANGGEPLPLPAAGELIDTLFARDATGHGQWLGGGLPSCPQLHFTAHGDRIVPSGTAAPGPRLESPAGHVGMIAGRDSPRLLHEPLRSWLDAVGKPG